MDLNARHLAGAYTIRVSRLVAPVFVGFLFLVLVGLTPFAERDQAAISEIALGEGDLARQILYIAFFGITLALALFSRGLAALRSVPFAFLLTIIWLIISASWSIEPAITLRRSVLTGFVAVTVFLSVEMLGARATVRALYCVLAAVLIANLFSLLLLPHAVHLPGEADPALVGSWRGLHYHKNIAGPIAALSAFLFLHFAVDRARRIDCCLAIGAIAFLLGTRSKTAIGLLIIVGGAAYLYRTSEARVARRTAFNAASAFVVVFVASVTLLFLTDVVDWINDPAVLTGRGAIWEVVLTSVRERPIAGVGYGAFWQSGAGSPAMWLSKEQWLTTVGHSHNGYLEILVTTGLPGLLLATVAAVLLPLRQLYAFQARATGVGALLFAVVVFVLLLNITEARLFERDRPEWVIFLIAVAVLHHATRNRRAVVKP